MKKISTVFKKDPADLGLVINEIDPANQWVADGYGIATRKFDGTACAVIGGVLYKRYDVKKGRKVPAGAIPCQDPDPITGHWPHWIAVGNGPEDQYHVEAFGNALGDLPDGTYELCGPKIQGNPERIDQHILVRHDEGDLEVYDLTFEGLKEFLRCTDIEGIVFHHPDGRMAKIRKSDFGIKR